MNYILVFIGAGLGGALRFLISTIIGNNISSTFPLGTLAVNFLGSLILGVLIFGFDDRELLSQNFKILLAVGFCGGLTTFSTFSLETINLLRNTEFFLAFINIVGNLLFSLVGVIIGYIITR